MCVRARINDVIGCESDRHDFLTVVHRRVKITFIYRTLVHIFPEMEKEPAITTSNEHRLYALIKFPRDEGFASYPVRLTRCDCDHLAWELRKSVEQFISACPFPKVHALLGQTFHFRDTRLGRAVLPDIMPDRLVPRNVGQLEIELVMGQCDGLQATVQKPAPSQKPVPSQIISYQLAWCPCGANPKFRVTMNQSRTIIAIHKDRRSLTEALRQPTPTEADLQLINDIEEYLNAERALAYCSPECQTRYLPSAQPSTCLDGYIPSDLL